MVDGERTASNGGRPMTLSTNGDYLTAREAATALGLSPVTVRRAFREGYLTGVRIGRSEGWSVIFIDPASLDSYREHHLGRVGRPRKEVE